MTRNYEWTPEQTERATAMIKERGAWLRYGHKKFRIFVSWQDDCFESDPYGGGTGPISVDLRDFDPLSLSEDDLEPLDPPRVP